MEIKLNSFSNLEADLIIMPLFSKTEDLIPADFKKDLEALRLEEKFLGDKDELFYSFVQIENKVKQVLLLGIGTAADLTPMNVKSLFSKAFKKVKALKSLKIAIEVGHFQKEQQTILLPSIIESLYLSNYTFSKYKSDTKEENLFNFSVNGIIEKNTNDFKNYISEAKVLAETTIVARDLVNEPANVIYPETLADEVVKFGKEYGFEVDVLNEKEIEDLNMKAFLSVAMGSDNPPRFIIMRYTGNPDQPKEILGFVGKGLTYDSGGYALKTAEGMATMKCDMAGAATVIGSMCAIAKQQLKINVTTVIAACENMISGGAYKNGDIINSMAGKTIEVLNTDAEGRLTLVDAVHYILEEEKVTKVVDVATLTGAVLVALGSTTTGVISNNDHFYKQLEEASVKSGERIWRLPAFDEYKEQLKSDVADLKNLGGRFAGTITAGLFIEAFVGETPWLHLDIAGTAWTDAEKDYTPKGGTGAGVRTLYHLAKGMA